MKTQQVSPEIRVATTLAIKELCKQWLEYERSIDTQESVDKTLWFNILIMNIINIDNVANTLSGGTGDNHILLRLSQLYLDVVLTFGEPMIELLHKETQSVIVQLNPNIYLDNTQGIRSYDSYRKTYPFIILIPLLNSLKNKELHA